MFIILCTLSLLRLELHAQIRMHFRRKISINGPLEGHALRTRSKDTLLIKKERKERTRREKHRDDSNPLPCTFLFGRPVLYRCATTTAQKI